MIRPLLIAIGWLTIASLSVQAQQPNQKISLDTARVPLRSSGVAHHPAFADKRKKAKHAARPTFSFQEIRGKRSATANRLSNGRLNYAAIRHASSAPTTVRSDSSDRMVYDRQRRLPILIERQSSDLSLVGPTARTSVAATSYDFLERVKDDMRIHQPREEFRIRTVETDRRGQKHVRMQQFYRDVPVYGSEIVLHTQQNQLRQLTGRYQATPSVSTVPSVSEQQAIATATRDVKQHTTFRALSADQASLLRYQTPSATLVVYRPDPATEPVLAWHVTLRPNLAERWEYFVNAHQGSVVDFYNHTCHIDGPRTTTANDLYGTARTLNVYRSGTADYLVDASRAMFDAENSQMPGNPVGAIITLDARGGAYNDTKLYNIATETNTWDPVAVSAHHNASLAYEYYLNVHRRNSINGQGGRVVSVVNVTDEDGSGFDNAFWNGELMVYGNGNQAFSPLARSLDVAGHEMTHGVISNTANLEYRDESGAINESIADVFGVLIEREDQDWQLGEDVVNRNVYPSGALRDMADPHNGGTRLGDRGFQPKHTDEMYTGNEDNGGVHINSGIPNYAFYLFATNESVGLEKAEQVYYQALDNYLTAFSQFVDLRIAVVQATADLYGADSPEVTAAEAAFDAVGIGAGEGTEDRPDLPTATGEEFILSYDVNPDDENTLYLSDTAGDAYVAKSTTRIKRKPSVTDDGTRVFFVSEEGQIRSLSLVGEPDEYEVQEETIWDNVAISKDGTKAAAITTTQDTAIYVYDFVANEWGKFKLYNPSFTEGVTTGEVLFADAIEWDYSGEYLIYDAFNQRDSPDGTDLSYWDVGAIRVWDNEANAFGDGQITKVFTSLPEGVNIGNPSYAKNSPTVVAFDRVDFNEDEYSIISADLATGEVREVYQNVQIGFPNYSVADDKLIFDAITEEEQEVTAVIGLAEDKITPVGSPAVLIPNAKWAVWLSQGERQVLSSEKELLTFSFEAFDPVISGTIDGTSIRVTVPGNVNPTRLIASFTHSTLSQVSVGEQEQVSGVSTNDFSQPVVYTVVAEDGSTRDYTVTVTLDEAAQLSEAKEMLSFSFEELDPPAVGTITGDSIIVFVPESTDVSALAATFTHSEAARVRVGLVGQESGVSVNDFTQPVTYTVIAEDQSSRDFTVVARVDRTTALADKATQRAITIYPNPVATQLRITATDVPQPLTDLVILDAAGKIVKRQTLSLSPGSTTDEEVSVVGLSPGIYTAKILLNNQLVVKRFIKE